jgi:hypothetical protein
MREGPQIIQVKEVRSKEGKAVPRIYQRRGSVGRMSFDLETKASGRLCGGGEANGLAGRSPAPLRGINRAHSSTSPRLGRTIAGETGHQLHGFKLDDETVAGATNNATRSQGRQTTAEGNTIAEAINIRHKPAVIHPAAPL